MAFDVGSVIAKIDADITGFKQGIREAQEHTNKLGDTLGKVSAGVKDFAEKASIMSAAVAAGFGLIAKQAISSAASYEQNRIAFETMLGSAEKAKKLLKEISDFAIKTPFELPQLVEGAQKLLAYNVEAEKIIPTMQMLGNLSAGLGTDKLPQLILAFGQVKAATKLTGMELRQFSEAGVPLLQALVDKANESGGVLTKVGGASKETTKKMASLASSIANTEFEMDYFKKTGGKTTEQLKSMQQRLDLTKAKLGQFGDVGQAVYKKVKVTAQEMIEKISDGGVTFNQVQEALMSMTGEGGKFFNLMEKQSLTFSGTISNIKDQIGRLLRTIVGISEEGDIKEGSIFEKLKQGATGLLNFLTAITPTIVNLVNSGLSKATEWFGKLYEFLKPIGDWVMANQALVLDFLKGMAIAFAGIIFLAPILIAVLNPFILVFAAIEVAAGLLYAAWNTNFMGIRDTTMKVVNEAINLFNNYLLPALQLLVKWFRDHWLEISMILDGAWKIITGIIEVGWNLIYGIFKVFLALLTGNWAAAWQAVKDTMNGAWDGVKRIFSGIIEFILGWGASVLHNLVSPFEDAWNRIKEYVQKIKDALDFTKRHSPSVLDIVNRGVREVNKALQGLDYNMNLTPNAAAMAVSNQTTNSPVVNQIRLDMGGAIITDAAGAMEMGELLGDSIIKKLQQNVRF